MLHPTRALLLAGLVILPLAVGAATKAASFVVRARVLDACTISVADDSRLPAVSGRCTPVTPYRIERDEAAPWRIDPQKPEAVPVQMVTITF